LSVSSGQKSATMGVAECTAGEPTKEDFDQKLNDLNT
jgi:hypothetical protein